MPPSPKPISDQFTEGSPSWPALNLGLGCWQFGGTQWGGQDDADSRAVMQAALDAGVTHFDTASGYGGGKSEKLVGQFLAEHGVRDRVLLASKQGAPGALDYDKYAQSIDASLERLQTDHVEIYYIHWPKSDADMRPVMRALEDAREAGKVKAVGVSNFGVDHMKQVQEVGRIDAHQLCYSLLWRFDERNGKIAHCLEHDIDLVTYSSLAQGILTGKFGAERPTFPEGDSRNKQLLFREEVWPHVYAGVEEMKKVAEQAGRPLAHLAMQWVASRPGVKSVLVGVRNAKQFNRNVEAFQGGAVDQQHLDALTAISDELMDKIPDEGNLFGYHP